MKINKTAYLVPDLFTDRTLQSTRDGFGEGLLASAKKNKNVIGLSADLSGSTRMDAFQKAFPKRFVQVGVAEQNLVTVAAGMAHIGKVPFASSFAAFCPGRCWEQIRTTIGYNDQNVKIVGSHTGVTVGPDGATHQMLEDIALMRTLPNMTVVVPCDSVQAQKATIAIAKKKGPCYLRLKRHKSPVFTTNKSSFILGKANVLTQGDDCAIIACGPLVYEALKAAKMLRKNRLSVRVIDSHTVKPLDKKTILKAAKECGSIVTVEEHQKAGGLGSAVSEFLSEVYPVPIQRIAVDDQYGESGTSDQLLRKFKLTAAHIVKAVRNVRKK